jgi:hypothetical protein
MAVNLPIADKTTLDTVNTTVGTTNTTVNAINTNVTTVNTNVGSNSDTSSSTGSVHAKLKDIKSSLSAGLSSIKSVQRGVMTSAIQKDSYIDVAISSVNISKAFVLIPSAFIAGASTTIKRGVYAQLTSTTNLRFSSDSDNDWPTPAQGSIAWQVVEFY